MPTINVLDSVGATVAIEVPNTNGQNTMANSRPVTIASDQSAVPISAAQLPSTIGLKLSASSLAVALSSDQASIPVNVNPAGILAKPATSVSLAALNATAQWQIEGGTSFLISVTNPAGATSQFVGTVSFQYSLDGTNWQTETATPLSSPTGANVSSTTTVGLWQAELPAGATVFFRALMSAYTSGTAVIDIAPTGSAGSVILLPWSYTVTAGQTLVGPFSTAGFAELSIQISAVTTTVLTVQGTNDPSLTTWDTIPVQEAKTSSVGATTITAAGTFRAGLASYKFARVQVTTTGTVLTVQGVSARIGPPIFLSAIGSGIAANIISGTVTTVSTVTNLSQIAAGVPATSIGAGSTNRLLGVSVGTAVSQTDVSAGAFAGAGGVNGTVIASAQAGGAVISAEINVSALTLGTATAVYAILQESTGGTNFSDIWVSDPITATGIIRMPAIPVAGRRRWRFFSVGGTSTTVTVTITTLELPTGSYIPFRQMRDAFAATNPFALVHNNAALTASTFVTSTLNSATTPMYIEGARNIMMFITLAGNPTVTTQPIFTLQLSMDGTNWWSTNTTVTAAGNGTYMAFSSQALAKFARIIVSTAAVFSAGAYTISNIGINASA